MKRIPTLKTERLLLRPFNLADAKHVQRLAGDYDIAKTTLNVPHPYEDGMAEEWIKTHQAAFEADKEIIFAVAHQQKHYLIGAIGISNIHREFERAEIGYWIGKPYWNEGFCTEAVKAVISYCFKEMKLNRVYAHHFLNNPASGRVMEKAGMKKEGVLRQHDKKWDKFVDTVVYGILRT